MTAQFIRCKIKGFNEIIVFTLFTVFGKVNEMEIWIGYVTWIFNTAGNNILASPIGLGNRTGKKKYIQESLASSFDTIQAQKWCVRFPLVV